eukprot:TRINITY_DN11093_c0_g1_i1.p1 TRINITY_DN11093_c0_g1~~TRINITY_DN11093_c0_g1_i1.p1  ORF type:complete len:556 (+),score=62.60 TRINITY_DN11093_c0_g1_i1:65-1669(+)
MCIRDRNVIVLCAALLLVSVCGALPGDPQFNPGLLLAIPETFVQQNLTARILKVVGVYIKDLTIPDFTYEDTYAWFVNVKFTGKNVHVVEFDVDDGSLSVNYMPPHRIHMQANEHRIKLKMDYCLDVGVGRRRVSNLCDVGYVTFAGFSAVGNIDFSRNGTKILLGLEDFGIGFGDLDIDLEGGVSGAILSFLINGLTTVIIPFMKKSITNDIHDGINQLIALVNNYDVRNIPIDLASINVDVSLVSDPIIQNGFLLIFLNGDFYIDGESPEILNPDTKLEYDAGSQKPQITVHQDSINSLSRAFLRKHVYNFTLNNDLIPRYYAQYFDSRKLNNIIPDLYAVRPVQMLNITILNSNEYYPEVQFVGPDHGGYTALTLPLNFMVNLQNGTNAFNGTVIARVKFSFQPVGAGLIGKLLDMKCLDLNSSDTRKIERNEGISLIQSLWLMAGPKVNGFLYEMTLRIPDLAFVKFYDLALYINKDYIKIETDMSVGDGLELRPRKHFKMHHFKGPHRARTNSRQVVQQNQPCNEYQQQ